MKNLILTLLPVFFPFALAEPIPAQHAQPLTTRSNFSYETLNFTFWGGPASYFFSFPADGGYYETENPLSISLIDPGTFPALSLCNFYTPNSSALVLDSSNLFNSTVNGITYGPIIDIGPPTPITAIQCAATGTGGMCLPVYASCEFYGPSGLILLDCCSGYCAASKCRCTDPNGCN